MFAQDSTFHVISSRRSWYPYAGWKIRTTPSSNNRVVEMVAV